MKNKLKIYVGCSLTNSPDLFVESVKKFKDNLRQDYEILDFVGKIRGTDTDVYLTDTQHVKNCDVFIAICDYPSLGLGYEIRLAVEREKRILALVHTDTSISRLITGIPYPNFKILKYSSLEKSLDVVKQELRPK